MEQQRIFRQRFIDNLTRAVKQGTGVELFRNSQFQFNEGDILIMPHIEKPLGLISKLDEGDAFKSGISLYEAYQQLTPLEAADSRFWNYLSLVDLYGYVRKCWPNVYSGKEGTNEQAYILEHFLITHSSGLVRHWLSGLWWSVYLSIDSSAEEKPYHLTEVMFWNETLRTRTMGTGLFARNKDVALGFLDYCKERGKSSFGNFDKEHRELTKYLNLVGGTNPLPFFSREEVKQILVDRFGMPEKMVNQ